jgi:4-oxalocrotonate tautomerase family enzyme
LVFAKNKKRLPVFICIRKCRENPGKNEVSHFYTKQKNIMPVVHVYVPEGWVSPVRKKIMIEKVTDAVVEAEGVPKTREMTYVLVHEVQDGGWGFQGNIYAKNEFSGHIPADPK